jgi:hypothetical protein
MTFMHGQWFYPATTNINNFNDEREGWQSIQAIVEGALDKSVHLTT